jgi:hypothetical protein
MGKPNKEKKKREQKQFNLFPVLCAVCFWIVYKKSKINEVHLCQTNLKTS